MTEENGTKWCFKGTIRRSTATGAIACDTSTVVLRTPTGWHVTKRTSRQLSSEGADGVSQVFVPDDTGALAPKIFAEEWERLA